MWTHPTAHAEAHMLICHVFGVGLLIEKVVERKVRKAEEGRKREQRVYSLLFSVHARSRRTRVGVRVHRQGGIVWSGGEFACFGTVIQPSVGLCDGNPWRARAPAIIAKLGWKLHHLSSLG